MRLPKLLMGSVLLLPLACGGDDGSNVDTGNDTGGSETGMTSPSTMSMTAADDDDGGMTTGGDDDGGNTTGEPPGGSSSGEPPADSSGSGEPPGDTGSGSDTGGKASACEMFCATYFEVCGESKANDYGDVGTCETACDGWSAEQFEDCRVPHLAMADGPNSPHCSHTNLDGGGQCPEG